MLAGAESSAPVDGRAVKLGTRAGGDRSTVLLADPQLLPGPLLIFLWKELTFSLTLIT